MKSAGKPGFVHARRHSATDIVAADLSCTCSPRSRSLDEDHGSRSAQFSSARRRFVPVRGLVARGLPRSAGVARMKTTMFRFRRLRTRIIVAFAILVTVVQAIAFVLVNAAND